MVLEGKIPESKSELELAAEPNLHFYDTQHPLQLLDILEVRSQEKINSTQTWPTTEDQSYSEIGQVGDVGWTGNLSEVSNSSCQNETCEDWHDTIPGLYRHSFGTGFVLCTGYILIFVLGLIGNCFVVAVVFRSPRMRTVTNYFIANLAVADILVIVFCLPANLISSIYVPWMLGWFMCKSFTYVQTVSVSASVNSLIAVSLDRFLAIWFPLRPQITKRTAGTLIVLIWIVAMVIAIPMAVYFDLVSYDSLPKWKFCVEVWPSRKAEKSYFLIAHLLLCYLLPLKLISAFYIMIWIKVASRSIPGDSRDATLREMQQRSKIKVVKMLAVVVLIFVLSWLPLYVVFARMKLGGELDEIETNVIAITTPVAQWLGASNSCINPILYAFLNKKFRTGFLTLIKSKNCCGSLRNDAYIGSTMRGCAYHATALSHTQRTDPQEKRTIIYSISGMSSFNTHQTRSYKQTFDDVETQHVYVDLANSRSQPMEGINEANSPHKRSANTTLSQQNKDSTYTSEMEVVAVTASYPVNGSSICNVNTTTTVV